MDNKKLLRINELAKKAETLGLTEDESKERDALRKEYVKSFRDSLRSTLENTVIMDKDGKKAPLKKKPLN